MNSNQDFHRLIFKPIRTVTIQFLVVILAIVFASPAFAQDWQKNRSGRLSPAKSSSGSPSVGQITTLKPSLSGDTKKRAELWESLKKETALLKNQSRVLKTLIKLVRPSIAHIEAQKITPSANGSKKVEETGAGVVFEYKSRHFILTNRHVIKDSENYQIKIMFDDGSFHNPIKLWSDRDSDIAVMELAGHQFINCQFGDSRAVESGDFVFAFGSPFGLKHSVSYGIVSAKGRRNLELGEEGVKYQDFFQTDAAINPGNSGGPLVNLDGEVIGINTAIASNSGGNDGVGFSIPIRMALKISHQLIDHGKVNRAFLGVQLESKFNVEKAKKLGMTRLRGAKVNLVNVGTPAYAAGLQPGDVILSFDGKEIEDDSDLVNKVSISSVGREIKINIWRDRRVQQLSTTLVQK
ncbi:MAG: trypsin-like peptidase domain-containing protein [Pirellulaceae bacterium]|nr:trypsin-like peptidase domain-containing protein [Pirellulaceae bacterium]